MLDKDVAIMRAVERFASSVTLPVLHEYSTDKVDQVGTGVLFDFHSRLMLVTARHIFDEIKPEDLVIPSRDTTQLYGIGPYELYRPDNPDIDIAIVELRHPESIQRARSTWKVLTEENASDANVEGRFVLTGYPSERNIHRGGLLGSSLLTLHTWRLLDVPNGADEPVNQSLDLFFQYDEDGQLIDGMSGKTPRLNGCSGGPIWEYREPAGMVFWTPEQCLTYVGVQSAYKPSKGYFRAKSWTYLQSMFEELAAKNPDLT